MGKKKKKKKVNPKRERYAKFRKEKLTNLTFSTPELTPEQQRQKQEDEKNIDFFLRRKKNPPTREVSDRKTRSKR